MAMRTTNFASLRAPGLRKVIFDDLEGRPFLYKRLFNVDDVLQRQKRGYIDDYPVSGLGAMPEKAEGVGVTYDEPVGGTTRRYTATTFGLGFRVTWEMQQDDLYNVANRMARKLSKSGRNRVNVDTFYPFNNGFGTNFTSYDSLSWFNTAHTLLRGGTQANRPAAELDFTVNNLQTALEVFKKFVDDDNQYVMIDPDLVLGAVEQQWNFKEVLESELRPDNANNAINAILGENLSYLCSPFYTDTDGWCLLGKPTDDHGLQWLWRQQFKFEESDDFDSGDSKFKLVGRYATGVTHYLGAWGTIGA
ncbi:MAG: hypothetical protein QME66_08275 [Candidatus Eisenbacteria bacterium]|nr:hypothetical protein [Candidatus Eisenbacteria bacterium]